jgi:hypothetical protein
VHNDPNDVAVLVDDRTTWPPVVYDGGVLQDSADAIGTGRTPHDTGSDIQRQGYPIQYRMRKRTDLFALGNVGGSKHGVAGA